MRTERQVKKAVSTWLGSVLVMLLTAVISLSVNAGYDEIPAQIIQVNVEKRQITLSDLDIQNINYRLAFNAEIRLLNGDLGSIANVRVGNYITAVVDPETKVIYAIYVLEN